MTRGFAPIRMKVWGDMACFTRPETKVERLSYDIMTPSAARGMFEAVFWKPEFQWHIHSIAMLKPVRFISLMRNEISSRQSAKQAMSWAMKGGGYSASNDRAQRHTLALYDVAYVIEASVVLRSHATDDVAKYRDQFRRRLHKGACFHIPYLGSREFAAGFCWPSDDDQPIDVTRNLGRMLAGIDYLPDGSGRGMPYFFDARLERGVLHIPERRRM